MKRRLLRRLLTALALALSAPAQAGSPPGLSTSRGFDEQGGAALYARVCAACHQPDARGAAGAAAFPSLAGDPRLGSLAYVESVLLQGRANMPALGRMMSDAQAADLINYVRTHFGNAFDERVSPEDIAQARAAR